MRSLFLTLVALCAALPLAAQTSSNTYETLANGVPSVVVVPTTLTTVATVNSGQYVRVNTINLHNVTGSAVTVTIEDRSTGCNSGPCPIIAPMTISGNSTAIIQLNGQPANNGIQWMSSSANAVMGWMQWTYVPQ